MSRPRGRAARAALLAATLALPAAAIVPQSASATTYAYWSYWHKAPGASSWTYSGSGPYYYRPADGSVEGWHFVTGSGGPSDPPPRARGAYSALCSTPSRNAGVQVAVILDFGSSVQKSCLTVPSGSSGSTVLTKAGANPRYNSTGLLCSIEGYPKSGCGQIVAPPPASPKPSAHTSTAPSPAPSRITTGRTNPPAHPATTPAGTSAGGGTGGTPGKSAASASRSPSVSPTAGTASPVGAASGTGSPAGTASPAAEEPFAPVAQRGSDTQGGFPVGLAVGVGLIAMVGAGATVAARRRRS